MWKIELPKVKYVSCYIPFHISLPRRGTPQRGLDLNHNQKLLECVRECLACLLSLSVLFRSICAQKLHILIKNIIVLLKILVRELRVGSVSFVGCPTCSSCRKRINRLLSVFEKLFKLIIVVLNLSCNRQNLLGIQCNLNLLCHNFPSLN